MNHPSWKAIALCLALATTTACAHRGKERSQSQTQSQPQTQASAPAESTSAASMAPAGFVLISENEYLGLQRLPLVALDESQRAMSLSNFGVAAEGVAIAAELLKVKADAAPEGDAKRELTTSVTSLEKLTPEIRAMRLKSPEQFSALLGDIAFYVSRFYKAEAQRKWQARQYDQAGRDLAAATGYIESGSKWIGTMADAGRLTSIRDVAQKLVDGTGWSQEDVSNAMAQLDQAVGSLGQSLGQATAPAAIEDESMSGTTSPSESGATSSEDPSSSGESEE